MKIINDIEQHSGSLSSEFSVCMDKMIRYFFDEDWNHVFGLSGALEDDAITVVQHAVNAIHSKAVYAYVESGDKTEDVVKSLYKPSKDAGSIALVLNPDVAADFVDCASLYVKPCVRSWHIKTVLSVKDSSIFDIVEQDELFWRIRRFDMHQNSFDLYCKIQTS